MNFRKVIITVCALLGATIPWVAKSETVHDSPVASESKDSYSCAENATTMAVCAGNEFKAADAELNAVYKQLMKKTDDNKRLIDAQRAWIMFRDADCSYAVGPYSKYQNGGAHLEYSYQQNSCLEELTRERIERLKKYIDEAR